MTLDDEIRKASAAHDRIDAEARALKVAGDAVAAAALPRLLELLAEGRDRLRAAGVKPIHVLAFRKESLLRSARFIKHAEVWKVSRVAISPDNRIFEVSHTVDRVTTRKEARLRGLSEGDSYVHLGHSTASRGGAQQVELRDCLSTHSGESGWFRGTKSGHLSVQTGNEPITYTALETVMAGEIAAATRHRVQ